MDPRYFLFENRKTSNPTLSSRSNILKRHIRSKQNINISFFAIPCQSWSKFLTGIQGGIQENKSAKYCVSSWASTLYAFLGPKYAISFDFIALNSLMRFYISVRVNILAECVPPQSEGVKTTTGNSRNQCQSINDFIPIFPLISQL